MLSPIEAYDKNADIFAMLAGDHEANAYEHFVNIPSLVGLAEDDITGEVLDFGCGSAAFLSYFQRDDRIFSGCDGSKRLIDIARHNNPNIEFFVWDAVSPLSRERRFQAVIAKLVLHYVEDIDVVLQNITGVLGQKGKLLVSVPHPDRTAMKVGDPLREQTYVDEIGSFGLEFQMVHRSVGHYNDAFTKAGFSLLRQEELDKRLNMLLERC